MKKNAPLIVWERDGVVVKCRACIFWPLFITTKLGLEITCLKSYTTLDMHHLTSIQVQIYFTTGLLIDN